MRSECGWRWARAGEVLVLVLGESMRPVLIRVVCGVTVLAGFVPARRATKVDPMVALR